MRYVAVVNYLYIT